MFTIRENEDNYLIDEDFPEAKGLFPLERTFPD